MCKKSTLQNKQFDIHGQIMTDPHDLVLLKYSLKIFPIRTGIQSDDMLIPLLVVFIMLSLSLQQVSMMDLGI